MEGKILEVLVKTSSNIIRSCKIPNVFSYEAENPIGADDSGFFTKCPYLFGTCNSYKILKSFKNDHHRSSSIAIKQAQDIFLFIVKITFLTQS